MDVVINKTVIVVDEFDLLSEQLYRRLMIAIIIESNFKQFFWLIWLWNEIPHFPMESRYPVDISHWPARSGDISERTVNSTLIFLPAATVVNLTKGKVLKNGRYFELCRNVYKSEPTQRHMLPIQKSFFSSMGNNRESDSAMNIYIYIYTPFNHWLGGWIVYCKCLRQVWLNTTWLIGLRQDPPLTSNVEYNARGFGLAASYFDNSKIVQQIIFHPKKHPMKVQLYPVLLTVLHDLRICPCLTDSG